MDRPIVLNSLAGDERIAPLVARLQDLCDEMGLTLDEGALEKCVLHLLYVEQVNAYINLTRITDLESALVLHVLDSLMFLPEVPEQCGAILDMGTGAGYPGLPLALSLDSKVTCLDSVGKKVKAVNAFASELDAVNVDPAHERLEIYAKSHRHCYDAVVARALAPLDVLLEYARPLLVDGGLLILSKGNPEEGELRSAEAAEAILGYRLVKSYEFDLPDGYGHRTMFVYKVMKPSSIKLPRKVGEARAKPLG